MEDHSGLDSGKTKQRKPYTIKKQREVWTDEEHEKFLEALRLFGRDWKRIEAHVGTKTVIQIRSHAQKYFEKVKKNKAEDIVIPPPRPKRKANTGRASTETSPPKRDVSSTSEHEDEVASNTNTVSNTNKQRSPRDTAPLTTTVDALKNQSYLLNPHAFAQWMMDNSLLTAEQSHALLERVPHTDSHVTDAHDRLLALNGVAESELHDLNSHVTADRARDPVLAAEIERQRSEAKQFIELAVKQAGGPASGESGAEHAGHEHNTRSVPHWADIYSFLGSLFDQEQSQSDDRSLSSRFAAMSAVDQQTVRVLMDNLLRVIHQPGFKDYHALLMQHYHSVVDQQHACD